MATIQEMKYQIEKKQNMIVNVSSLFDVIERNMEWLKEFDDNGNMVVPEHRQSDYDSWQEIAEHLNKLVK